MWSYNCSVSLELRVTLYWNWKSVRNSAQFEDDLWNIFIIISLVFHITPWKCQLGKSLINEKTASQLRLMFGVAVIITLSRCGPHFVACVLEQRGWEERSTGCLLTLNWNEVTQHRPVTARWAASSRKQGHYLGGHVQLRARCSTITPVLTVKSKGDQKCCFFWSHVTIINEILL